MRLSRDIFLRRPGGAIDSLHPSIMPQSSTRWIVDSQSITLLSEAQVTSPPSSCWKSPPFSGNSVRLYTTSASCQQLEVHRARDTEGMVWILNEQRKLVGRGDSLPLTIRL